MKVIKESSTDVCVQRMRDGDIGVVVAWNGSSKDGYVGRVVQRYGENLISLGMGKDNSWCGLFGGHNRAAWEDCLVRILNPGTKLEV